MHLLDQRTLGIAILVLLGALVIVKKMATGSILEKPKGDLLAWLTNAFNLFFLLVVNVVYVFFDTFGIIDAVTGGGPAGATTTMVYKVYADGRLGGDLGGSAAQSVVLMVIVITLTAIQFRYVERKVQY